MQKNSDKNGDIAQKGDQGPYQAHFRTLAHPEPIEQPDQSPFQAAGEQT